MIPKAVHNIVEGVYTDKRVREFIGKLKPSNLQEDLLSHCICEIYRIAETYPGKIEALHERQQMFAWFVGMAKIQLMSPRSTFYRKHRREFADEELIDAMKPDEAEPFEFKYADPERERLAQWAYDRIENPNKPPARYTGQVMEIGVQAEMF